MFLTHVYNFKYVFNSTVIKLSWHVLCYLISKNLYSLQNAQPFIFQLICMQLCKCINCFLKAHNKQLNQYCLNFTIFFTKKKKVLKKWFGFGLDWPAKNTGRVTGQPVFASGQKNRVWVGSKNFDPFCHVYKLGLGCVGKIYRKLICMRFNQPGLIFDWSSLANLDK